MTGNLKLPPIDYFEPNQCAQQVEQLQQYQRFPIHPTILQQCIHPFHNRKNLKLPNFLHYF